jgi:hypothetical protein
LNDAAVAAVIAVLIPSTMDGWLTRLNTRITSSLLSVPLTAALMPSTVEGNQASSPQRLHRAFSVLVALVLIPSIIDRNQASSPPKPPYLL